MNYKIALVNVFWSEDEQNTRYFERSTLQDDYFDSLASGKTSPLVNYNMGNNVETTIVYRDTTSRSVDEIVKSNYAIVYTVNVNPETKQETIINRRYFFAYPRQDSGRQFIVRLSLDDIQTNYVQYQGLFDNEVLINRACLNRFREAEDNKIEFDLGNEDSPFYLLENFKECSKRLIRRTPLDFKVDERGDLTTFNEYFNNSIIGWEYVYLAPKDENAIDYESLMMRSQDYDAKWVIDSSPMLSYFYGSQDNQYGNGLNQCNKCRGAYICLCAPIYKYNSLYGRDNTIWFNSDDYSISVSSYGIEEFLKMNGMYSYVYARKFSIRPPFRHAMLTENYDYSYDSEHNRLNIPATLHRTPISSQTSYNYMEALGVHILYTGVINDTINNIKYRQGCLYIPMDYDGYEPYETQLYHIEGKPLSFNLTDIINKPKDPKFNPKLLGNNFFEVNITNFSQSFTYDYSKLGSEEITILYNEALTPDITKGYARVDCPTGLYVNACDMNLTGLVISNDYSLMVANDQLSQMLANNKNFFLQQALNVGKSFVGSTLGGLLAGGERGAVMGGIGSLLKIPEIGLEVDNMRNAPAQLRNANGNVYFASDIQPFKLAIEEYDVLDYDKKQFNDYCHMFGFNYGRLGKLRDFVNIRYNFNYIEAELFNVRRNISNLEKERLREKFNRGIRFWNSDIVDFTKENFENWVYNKYMEINNE